MTIATQTLNQGKFGNPIGALLYITKRDDHPYDHIVNRNIGRECRVGFSDFFKDQNGILTGQPSTTIVFSDVNPAKTHLAGFSQYIHREVFFSVPLQRTRRYALAHKVAHYFK